MRVFPQMSSVRNRSTINSASVVNYVDDQDRRPWSVVRGRVLADSIKKSPRNFCRLRRQTAPLVRSMQRAKMMKTRNCPRNRGSSREHRSRRRCGRDSGPKIIRILRAIHSHDLGASSFWGQPSAAALAPARGRSRDLGQPRNVSGTMPVGFPRPYRESGLIRVGANKPLHFFQRFLESAQFYGSERQADRMGHVDRRRKRFGSRHRYVLSHERHRELVGSNLSF